MKLGEFVPVAWLLGMTLLCVGCTASQATTSQSATLSVTRATTGSPGSSPAGTEGHERPTSPFAMPLSAITWWRDHPELSPLDLSQTVVVVDQEMQGPGALDLPDLSSYSSVLMAITCSSEQHYVLQLGTDADPAWTWTMGESCGGPSLTSFTSQPLDPLKPVTTLYVQVPHDTQYVVSVLGILPFPAEGQESS